MSHLSYYIYPGAGEYARDNFGYNQAVRVGDKIEIAGQGGWDDKTMEVRSDLKSEIEQAFKNVDLTLRSAGGEGWSQVYKMVTYHTDITPEVTKTTIEFARQWMPDHKPIWTQVGVKQLGLPDMHIEIEVVAHVPQE